MMSLAPMVLHARVVTGTGGGPDKTILNSARFLDGDGYRTLCVFMRDPSDALFAELEERARRWHAPMLAVDDHGALDWRIMQRLREVCALYRPAIWHGHDYKSNLLGLRLEEPGLRRVTTVHGWVKRTWKTPLYYWLDRRSIRRYDQVVCVSTDLYERCLEFGVPAERCWYVPNGVDTEEFRRDMTRGEAKALLDAPLDRPLIGMVGRLSGEKRCDLVIRALGLLRDSGVEAGLWIAGEGPERQRLERLVADLGLAERVRFLGFVTDTRTPFQALDMLVMSSVREGLPNALLEAMAFEIPVVATRIAGIPGLIADGENGLLVDAASAELIQRAIARLIGDPELAMDLGRAARRTVVEAFSFGGRMSKIRQIYDETLGAAAAGAGAPR